MFSSGAFDEEYYRTMFSGRRFLLENIPQRALWEAFRVRRPGAGVFTIAYIGVVRYLEPLLALIDAVEHLNENHGFKLRVLFAGGGDHSHLRARVKKKEFFEFRGPFEYSREIVKLYEGVNLIFAVYDRADRNCQLAMPTKFYESLLSRIPILVSSGTHVGRMVEARGIGRAVDADGPHSIVGVLSEMASESSWYDEACAKLDLVDHEACFTHYDAALSMAVSSG